MVSYPLKWRNHMTSNRFKVYQINDKGKKVHIDTVYLNGYTEEAAVQSLINHDGYPYNITVKGYK